MIKKQSPIILEESKTNFLNINAKNELNIRFNRIAFIFFIFLMISLIYSIHLLHLGSRKSKSSNSSAKSFQLSAWKRPRNSWKAPSCGAERCSSLLLAFRLLAHAPPSSSWVSQADAWRAARESDSEPRSAPRVCPEPTTTRKCTRCRGTTTCDTRRVAGSRPCRMAAWARRRSTPQRRRRCCCCDCKRKSCKVARCI